MGRSYSLEKTEDSDSRLLPGRGAYLPAPGKLSWGKGMALSNHIPPSQGCKPTFIPGTVQSRDSVLTLFRKPTYSFWHWLGRQLVIG